MTPKTLKTKVKIDKWGYQKLKSCFTTNKTHRGAKWKMKKMLYSTGNGLCSKIYMELKQ